MFRFLACLAVVNADGTFACLTAEEKNYETDSSTAWDISMDTVSYETDVLTFAGEDGDSSGTEDTLGESKEEESALTPRADAKGGDRHGEYLEWVGAKGEAVDDAKDAK